MKRLRLKEINVQFVGKLIKKIGRLITQIRKKIHESCASKKFLFKNLAIILIFLLDRIAKIYILKLAELENTVDFYLTSYLNIYLIDWISCINNYYYMKELFITQ